MQNDAPFKTIVGKNFKIYSFKSAILIPDQLIVPESYRRQLKQMFSDVTTPTELRNLLEIVTQEMNDSGLTFTSKPTIDLSPHLEAMFATDKYIKNLRQNMFERAADAISTDDVF